MNRVHEFGIDAVELDFDEVKPGKEEMREQFRNAGISVASMYAFFDFGNAPDAEPGFRFIDTAEYLGASKVLVIPGFIEESEGPAERENALNRMVGVLREMCNYAERKNMIITMEEFDDIRAPFSSSDELLWFMKQVPKLRCTFDTGNFIYRGENELEAFEKLRDKIVHVHCKDCSLDEHNGGTPKFCTNGTKLFPSPVGYGCISIDEILHRLIADGYNDIVAIEHFDAADELSYIQRSAEWLRSRLSGA
ncbi:sugar phosphate isomerase/epimerase [Fontibacillus solani]|uniref:Sugar phosphate isomerase/epimerase n=1 Tax=Fontibacillus solani TaxID=1572857 RepID=A0A7W3SXX7_9BACL|nr:sugar phosphate isomerase/epimerase family protein [Fontibacillus solani]MBA9087983.1 sugar phosphate isomerase/epimerase [Fontibacillus solani]